MNDELKPCLCGANTYAQNYDAYVWFIECEDGCLTSDEAFESKEEAIEAWNKRA